MTDNEAFKKLWTWAVGLHIIVSMYRRRKVPSDEPWWKIILWSFILGGFWLALGWIVVSL